MNDNGELTLLFERARGGEEEAREALLAWLRTWLRPRAERLLGPGLRHRVDASDVAQEACLRIHGALECLPADCTTPHLLAWAQKILRNLVTDYRRRHGADRRNTGREVAGDDLFSRLAAEVTPPVGRVLRNEDAEHLEEALQRLPEIHREVIQLRVREELANPEVARRLDIRPANVSLRLLRAIEHLRKDERLRKDLGESR
jgi:RNA polymerase sigma-70 factor (ECF subfamily)